MEQNPKLYQFISQGVVSIDNVDDCDEMKMTEEAFDILNFTQVSRMHT